MKKLLNKFLKNFNYEISKIKSKPLYSLIEFNGKSFKFKYNEFWENEFSVWETQTFDIFKKYLKTDKSYIDVGTWIGPTIAFACSIGVEKIWGVEANPLTYGILNENICMNESLAKSVSLLNLCITNKENGYEGFGFDYDVEASTSSINRSDWTIKTTTLSKYIENNKIEDFNFIKIDIEGAEILLTEDLKILSEKSDLVIYLSLHPAFWLDKTEAANKLLNVFKLFDIYDANDKELSPEHLLNMLLTEEQLPEWGTKFGNFFEILLKSKKAQ